MASDRRAVAQAVTEIIEQLFRHAYGDSFVEGLNPAQWAALRFLSRAQPSSRTVAAFARWQRTTTGTASQTIAALTRKGHLAKAPMGGDRRQIRLDLTESGRALLRRDPIRALAGVIERLPPERVAGLVDGLTEVARGVFDGKAQHPTLQAVTAAVAGSTER